MHVLVPPPLSMAGVSAGILGLYIGYVRCDGVLLHVYAGYVK